MTDDAMLGSLRRRLILRAQELDNVSQACREFQLVGVDTFYVGRLKGVARSGEAA